MAWSIELPPETERQIEQEAARRGQDPRALVRELVQQRLADLPHAAPAYEAAWLAELPRATPDEVQAFLRTEGARPIQQLEELQGDVWPEGEDVDEFLKARRQWQREGAPGFPWQPAAGAKRGRSRL